MCHGIYPFCIKIPDILIITFKPCWVEAIIRIAVRILYTSPELKYQFSMGKKGDQP